MIVGGLAYVLFCAVLPWDMGVGAQEEGLADRDGLPCGLRLMAE